MPRASPPSGRRRCGAPNTGRLEVARPDYCSDQECAIASSSEVEVVPAPDASETTSFDSNLDWRTVIRSGERVVRFGQGSVDGEAGIVAEALRCE